MTSEGTQATARAEERNAPGPRAPAIAIDDLGIVFEGGVTAIERLDLTVYDEEFLVVLGPSGCGKSTLLLVLAGLIRPTSGEVRVHGRVNPPPGKDRGFVFQQAGLLPWFDVLTNIELGLRAKGLSRTEARAISQPLARKFGLEGFEHKYPHQLSGGMQQRVGVARAFAIDPPILLMDEPFGALDAQTRVLLQEELIRLWEGSHKTVVFVTHSIDEAIFLADRIMVMQARPGRVLEMVNVPLPRPRGDRTRQQPEYLALQSRLWDMLRSEAERAFVD
jgi:ABC-type nitrate/sulfonate/bicarbonate transport system ATPase subunit